MYSISGTFGRNKNRREMKLWGYIPEYPLVNILKVPMDPKWAFAARGWNPRWPPNLLNLYYNSPKVCLSVSRHSQTADRFLLDRLGRYRWLFVSSDSTSSHEFACQFGLAFLLYSKNPQNLGETWPPVPVFIWKASDPLLSPAERAVTVGWHRIAIQRRRCVCVWGVCRRSRGWFPLNGYQANSR